MMTGRGEENEMAREEGVQKYRTGRTGKFHILFAPERGRLGQWDTFVLGHLI